MNEPKDIRHLDLFSGIGGFAYAVDQVWPNSEHIFCDNDQFCQAVLHKHWPNSKIYGDIRTITDTSFKGLEREEQKSKLSESIQPSRCFILTGGFPCQPFSQAGKRRGTADDRYLWPEMLRVIQLAKPQWVIAENVRGLLTQQGGVVFEQVCADLEANGYEVQPFVIPAVAVNAPHRRDRIWIIANRTKSGGELGEPRKRHSPQCEKGLFGRKNSNAPDPRPQYGQQGNKQGMETDPTKRTTRSTDAQRQDKNASDTSNERLEGRERQKPIRYGRFFSGDRSDERWNWDKDWIEVATQLCGVDDGLPVELDGFKLSKSRHRVERLKSLGNAIVPQVAIEIMKAIELSQL